MLELDRLLFLADPNDDGDLEYHEFVDQLIHRGGPSGATGPDRLSHLRRQLAAES